MILHLSMHTVCRLKFHLLNEALDIGSYIHAARPHYTRCVVVGSSGILSGEFFVDGIFSKMAFITPLCPGGSGLGPRIDSYDAVFRVNEATCRSMIALQSLSQLSTLGTNSRVRG